LQCEDDCRASLEGGACTCPKGKKVADDGRTCVDENECELWGPCDQKCINTVGSHQCTCVSGYERRGDTCKAKTSYSKMKLYVAQHSKILAVDLTPTDNGNNAKQIMDTESASGLDYHLKKKALFYTDVEKRKVFRIGIDPAHSTARPADYNLAGAWLPISVAVDWVGNNIYVVDALGQKVDVFDIDNIYHAIVLSSNLTAPVDIALDPIRGFMFLTDNDRVVRANMDGSFLRALVTDTVYKASGLAVDLATQRIFWSDILLDYIETVNYNGEDRQRVARGPTNVPAPSRLAVFERTVYWTDGTKQGVFSVDKFDGEKTIRPLFSMTESAGNGKEPRASRAVHPHLPPAGFALNNNPCNRSSCEHLCIVTGSSENGGNLGYR